MSDSGAWFLTGLVGLAAVMYLASADQNKPNPSSPSPEAADSVAQQSDNPSSLQTASAPPPQVIKPPSCMALQMAKAGVTRIVDNTADNSVYGTLPDNTPVRIIADMTTKRIKISVSDSSLPNAISYQVAQAARAGIQRKCFG